MKSKKKEKQRKSNFFFLLLFFLSFHSSRSQVLFEVGAGTHSLFVGIKLYQKFVLSDVLYSQILLRGRFYINNFVPKKKFAEVLIAPKLSLTSRSKLQKPLSVASYEWHFFSEREFFVRYNFFLDTRKTSQTTGMLGVRLQRWAFVFDNDVLAFTGEDRFRTGAFGFFYYLPEQEISLKYISFTGDQRYGKSMPPTEEYPREYKDLSQAPYGKHSVGTICLEVATAGIQIPYLRIGLDDERFRHFFQNKLIHDAPIIRNNNVHYPPLDIHGNPKVSDTQTLRPAKFYFETGLQSYFLY